MISILYSLLCLMTTIHYTSGSLWPAYLIIQVVYDNDDCTLHSRFSMTIIPYAPGCLWPPNLTLKVVSDHFDLNSWLSMTTKSYTVLYGHFTLYSRLSMTTTPYAPGCLWPVLLSIQVDAEHGSRCSPLNHLFICSAYYRNKIRAGKIGIVNVKCCENV